MARTDKELLSYYQNEQASIKNGTGFSSDQGYADLINNKVNEYANKVNAANNPIVSQPIQQQPIKQTQPVQQPVQTQPTQQPAQAQPQTQQSYQAPQPSGQDIYTRTLQQQSQYTPLQEAQLETGIYNTQYTANPNYDTTETYKQIQNTQPFQNQYQSQMQNALQAAQQQFSYNPNNDAFLQQAQTQAMNAVTTEMNRRGIANSDQSRFEAYKQASSLVPQYEAMAYQRFNDNISNQLKTAEFLQKVTMDDYQIYKDSLTNLYNKVDVLNQLSTADLESYKANMKTLFDAAQQKQQDRVDQLNAAKEQIKIATDRVDQLKFVDNDASIILGLPVGTPSKFAVQLGQTLEKDITLEAVKTQNKMTEDDNKFKNDLKEADYKEELIRKQKEDEANAVGTAFAAMSNLTIEDAILTWQQIGKEMISKIGTEQYMKVATYLQNVKNSKDDSEYKDQQLSLQQLNAKINAGQLAVAQYNAETSRQNANTSEMNAETNRLNYQLDQQKQDNQANGKKQYSDESKIAQTLDTMSTLDAKLGYLQSPDIKDEIISSYGMKYYNDLVKTVKEDSGGLSALLNNSMNSTPGR